jgi:hypothetical protein
LELELYFAMVYEARIFAVSYLVFLFCLKSRPVLCLHGILSDPFKQYMMSFSLQIRMHFTFHFASLESFQRNLDTQSQIPTSS